MKTKTIYWISLFTMCFVTNLFTSAVINRLIENRIAALFVDLVVLALLGLGWLFVGETRKGGK